MFKIRVSNYLETVRSQVNYDRDATYVIISIQDGKGFGFTFNKTDKCKDVLTLYFDDLDTVRGTFKTGQIDQKKFSPEEFEKLASERYHLFSEEDAKKIVDFVEKYKDTVDELWIHCYAGISRSQAVAAAISKYYTGDDEQYFRVGIPNMRVFRKTLEEFHKED